MQVQLTRIHDGKEYVVTPVLRIRRTLDGTQYLEQLCIHISKITVRGANPIDKQWLQVEVFEEAPVN